MATDKSLNDDLAQELDELIGDEMLAACAAANLGIDGWDAPDMELYDTPEYAPANIGT